MRAQSSPVCLPEVISGLQILHRCFGSAPCRGHVNGQSDVFHRTLRAEAVSKCFTSRLGQPGAFDFVQPAFSSPLQTEPSETRFVFAFLRADRVPKSNVHRYRSVVMSQQPRAAPKWASCVAQWTQMSWLIDASRTCAHRTKRTNGSTGGVEVHSICLGAGPRPSQCCAAAPACKCCHAGRHRSREEEAAAATGDIQPTADRQHTADAENQPS